MTQRTITIGFTVSVLCFPLREWENWKWGREFIEQMFAVGPFRLQWSRHTTTRTIGEKEDKT